MSIRILTSQLSPERLDQIGSDLTIDVNAALLKNKHVRKKRGRQSFQRPKYVYPYELVEEDGVDVAYLPFAYAVSVGLARPARKNFPRRRAEFGYPLREEQEGMMTELLPPLSRTGSVIVSAYPGAGKTCLSIFLTVKKLKMPALVVMNRIMLMKQWLKAIAFFTNGTARAQIVKSGDELDPEADFYIMNAINVPKRPRSEYAHIGVVIIDELHLITSEKLSECFGMVYPRYLVGLSATPYRMDGLDILIQLYFGQYQVIRKLHRSHDVYQIKTGFIPDLEQGAQGLNWGKVLSSQGENEERNRMIVNLIKLFPERVFLVLCKRRSQARRLVEMLQEEKEDVTHLIGSEQEFEQSARVLVSIVQKTGTGFDHPRLNTLILAADMVNYFIQYLGRVFRTKEGVPMVFDIIDDFSTLKNHARDRAKVFRECGGTLRNFKNRFPDFEVI